MDELNKRVLSIMELKGFSKSTFAIALEISLPVLTHISSGRNKPGLEMIQKILLRFPDISPDWLLLGQEPMLRKRQQSINIDQQINSLGQLSAQIPAIIANHKQTLEYHQILTTEINYLKDLDHLLTTNATKLQEIMLEIESAQAELISKVND